MDHYQDPTPYDELVNDPSPDVATKLLQVLGLEPNVVNKRAMMSGLSHAMSQVRDHEYPPRVVLKDCPFCGHRPDPRNYIDSIHPVNREAKLWTAGCVDNEGGCNAHALGGSRDEAIANWNMRQSDRPHVKRVRSGRPNT